MSQTPKSEAELFFQQGLRHREAFEYKAAIANFGKALVLQSDLYEACFNRGCSIFFLHRYEEAIASLTKL